MNKPIWKIYWQGFKYIGHHGKHHWLNWPMTIILILIFYGLYTGISGSILKFAELKHNVDANTGLVILILFTGLVMTGTYNWQKDYVPLHSSINDWLKYYVSGIISIWLVNIITNLVFTPFLTKQTQVGSNQQDLVNLFFTPGPIQQWTILSTIIIAPFFEEFVFRLNLIGPKTLNKKSPFHSTHRKLYATISIILFTYLHVMDDVNSLISHYTMVGLISLFHSVIIYGLTGLILSYVYMKSNDIRYSISVHMTWNFISLVPMLYLILVH